MAQRRDARGRFAGGGGGGGGGGKKGGKKKATGMKNQVAAGRAAKAKYKAATSQARQAKMLAGGRTSTRGLGKRTDAGAKSIRTNVKAYQSAQAKVRKMEANRGTAGKTRTATASKKGKAAGGMKNQVAAGRKAKANYKAATSQARQAKMLAGGRTSTRGLGKRTDAGAKNIRSNVKAYQSAAAKVRRMESKRSTGATRRRKA